MKRIFNKDIKGKDIFGATFLVLGLIWLRCFIQQNSYYERDSSCMIISFVICTAVATAFYFWIFFEDPFELRENTRQCLSGTAVSGILFLAALLLEIGLDNFSIYGGQEIILLGFEIPKKFVFDIWALVWFPYNISVLFRAMRKEKFDCMAVMRGCIVIAGLSLEGILLFRPMSNIWLVDLMILNVLTVAFAVWKYAFPEEYIKKLNAIAGVILYVIMRIIALPAQCDRWGKGVAYFMYGESWDGLKAMIHEIAANASFFGTSEYLRNSTEIHEWLLGRNKSVMQLLYYGGWASVIGLVVVLLGLIILLLRLINVKNGRIHKNWLIYVTASTMLIERAVMGILYGFGVPFPLNLPFQGNGIMDTMAFTIILFGAIETILIQKHQNVTATFVPAEEILGRQDAYQIVDEDTEPYTEEFLLDVVKIIGTDSEFMCEADWYSVADREFCVFKMNDDEMEVKRFILELKDNKWIALQDQETRGIVIEKYKNYNSPDCLEEEVSYVDEEYKEECFEDF